MSGKGAKGLIMGKSSSAALNNSKDKDKKKAVSRSSRAGLQVPPPPPPHLSLSIYIYRFVIITIIMRIGEIEFKCAEFNSSPTTISHCSIYFVTVCTIKILEFNYCYIVD